MSDPTRNMRRDAHCPWFGKRARHVCAGFFCLRRLPHDESRSFGRPLTHAPGPGRIMTWLLWRRAGARSHRATPSSGTSRQPASAAAALSQADVNTAGLGLCQVPYLEQATTPCTVSYRDSSAQPAPIMIGCFITGKGILRRHRWPRDRSRSRLCATGKHRKSMATSARPADPPSAFKPPICPACSKAMQLDSAMPDIRYSNLRHVIFKCDCGWTSDQLVADKD